MRYIQVIAEATIKVPENYTEEQIEAIKVDTFLSSTHELMNENYLFEE